MYGNRCSISTAARSSVIVVSWSPRASRHPGMRQMVSHRQDLIRRKDRTVDRFHGIRPGELVEQLGFAFGCGRVLPRCESTGAQTAGSRGRTEALSLAQVQPAPRPTVQSAFTLRPATR